MECVVFKRCRKQAAGSRSLLPAAAAGCGWNIAVGEGRLVWQHGKLARSAKLRSLSDTIRSLPLAA